MHTTHNRTRHDGWTPARRVRFLEALRVGSKVVDACAWAGMSSAGAYALAKREPGSAAVWLAAYAARDDDRRPAQAMPVDRLDDVVLIHTLRTLDNVLQARPRGIVAQQNKRWA